MPCHQRGFASAGRLRQLMITKVISLLTGCSAERENSHGHRSKPSLCVRTSRVRTRGRLWRPVASGYWWCSGRCAGWRRRRWSLGPRLVRTALRSCCRLRHQGEAQARSKARRVVRPPVDAQFDLDGLTVGRRDQESGEPVIRQGHVDLEPCVAVGVGGGDDNLSERSRASLR